MESHTHQYDFMFDWIKPGENSIIPSSNNSKVSTNKNMVTENKEENPNEKEKVVPKNRQAQLHTLNSLDREEIDHKLKKDMAMNTKLTAPK